MPLQAQQIAAALGSSCRNCRGTNDNGSAPEAGRLDDGASTGSARQHSTRCCSDHTSSTHHRVSEDLVFGQIDCSDHGPQVEISALSIPGVGSTLSRALPAEPGAG